MFERLLELAREFVVGVLNREFIGARELAERLHHLGHLFLVFSHPLAQREPANDERGLRPGVPRERRRATAHVAVHDERTTGLEGFGETHRRGAADGVERQSRLGEQVSRRELGGDRAFIF